jgi:hypothetical protein
VEAGEIAPDAQGVNLDPKVRDAYLRMWQNESKAGGDFTPSTGMMTNQVSGTVTPYFMSSPNSAQIMAERQPALKPVSGKDGKAYNYNPVTGTYAPALIEGTTNQFEMDAKSNALADALAAMAGPQGSAPQESGGFLSGLFGGGAPAASPTPSPTPAATPMATPAATPMPAMAGTNAPVPVAAPALSTPEAVRAAFLAGQISEADAVRMLRGGR